MKTNYTVVNTYSSATDVQKEKLKAEASRAVYRELLRYMRSNRNSRNGKPPDR